MPSAALRPQPGEARRLLLARLQAEIHALGGTALVALGGSDNPVLYTVRDGRRVAVVAVRVGDAWWFIWGRRDQAAAEHPDAAARRLTGPRPHAPAGLLARRPQPRGARRSLKAVA
ncbi:hypothetical protein [Actinorugispora endophytica]|nr:hypothetical protein [Actinorugispora endophytica]